jgi:hypothetical protein
MKRAAYVIFIGLISVFVLMLSASAQARPDVYSNKSLKGPYSFLLNQWTSDTETSGMTSILGVATFDGAGDVTFSDGITNNDGDITTFSGTGTYSVGKTGIGSISLTSGASTATFGIVADSGGKSFEIILYSCAKCNTGLSGTAIAMGASSFTNASLKGSFAWMTNKWTASQNTTAEGGWGTFSFDGVGKVSVAGSWAVEGQALESIPASGTYTVNSDGSGSMNITNPSGTTFTASFVINTASANGTGAKGIQYIETASSSSDFDGAVFTGTATKQ